MKATYQEHTIEAIKMGDGLYHATVDGQETDITSRYKIAAIKRAMQAIDEQARTQRIAVLKEIGL